jgi:hypothetical protein
MQIDKLSQLAKAVDAKPGSWLYRQVLTHDRVKHPARHGDA